MCKQQATTYRHNTTAFSRVRIPVKRKPKSIFPKFVGSSYVYKTITFNLITSTLITVLIVTKQTPDERRRGSAPEQYVNLSMPNAFTG
jgi:hypothetical protein